ncbi:mRNA-capping enzyme, putative [Plasmodium knowlesi strain H]|uniref:mRNA 5'-phosphatase n=3 Tax=Plasmodium knowlesi TaxID=5850 RepID=A0A5K1TW57_PLAKH|nr:mRNA-capping enzyme subunit beta, putative [Plasmodium knowlesi strain H]OTN65788.1 putative Mrna capping enzyme [Plasmodium knowlesi]CAA9987830.1 mRNA-capping enzyme subunit beta, putative [Plasmodium knowlesi strain H]SBO22357.1 mRNA-capping enzyme, putative [Plasmodium knowlesi strain H]SBO28763.1 mRNA-capping enzyme, putative [Plasmodium knowlesi strain H]VVS77304.1 mRNA-capping enzyme subunit beta, putative [Plasmodium knowlesi strain H]|eukprot:XP_002258828.1 mrna capping enzyme, putative [Plasmodium knowlesi strain H]
MVREAHELLDGSRPIPIDKITYELSQNIILAFDSNELGSSKDTQIEVETRIGFVIDKNKNRIRLPSNTDAIVENNYSDFSSGVDKHSFEYLLNYLHSLRGKDGNKWGANYGQVCNGVDKAHMLKVDKGTEGNACTDGTAQNGNRNIHPCYGEEKNSQRENYIYEFFSTKKVRSVDKYYVLQNENSRVRVTTYLDEDSGGENESMAKSLCKRNLNTWNIYMGNNKDYFDDDDDDTDEDDEENSKGKKKRKTDHGESEHPRSGDECVDYRIAINLEQTKRISKLFLSKLSPVHERVKERTSFINKFLGIQLDLTKIKTKDDGGEIYEIEIEILSKSILKAMSNLRYKNDSNYLLFICSNLINNARGICRELYNFRKRQTLGKEVALDDGGGKGMQSTYVHPSREKKKFEKYVHSVTPIIGDYMYRVVAKNEEKIHAILQEENLSNRSKIEALQKLIDIRRHNKKSVKKISETYAENRWRVVRTQGAQGEVVLVSEGSEGSEESDEMVEMENVEPTGFNFDNSSASGSEGGGDKGEKDNTKIDNSKYKNFYSDT